MLSRLVLVLSALEAAHDGTRAGNVLSSESGDLVGAQNRVVLCEQRRSVKLECARSEGRTSSTAVADLILGSSLALVLVVANASLRQSVEDVRLVFVVLAVDPRLEVGTHLALDQGVVVVKVGVVESWTNQVRALAVAKKKRSERQTSESCRARPSVVPKLCPRRRRRTFASNRVGVDVLVLPGLQSAVELANSDEFSREMGPR